LLLATLLLPPLRDALHPDSTAFSDLGQLVSQSAQSIVDQLKTSRRDTELARQILLATRYLFPSSTPNRRRPKLEGREFFEDAQHLVEIVTDAETSDSTLQGHPAVAPEGSPVVAEDEALPPDLQPQAERPGRRRGRRDRQPTQPNEPNRATESATVAAPAQTVTPVPVFEPRISMGTPIPSLDNPLASVPLRPAFLGTGRFGSRWGASAE
jgi:hypothetical protein